MKNNYLKKRILAFAMAAITVCSATWYGGLHVEAADTKVSVDGMIASNETQGYPASRAIDGVTVNGGANTHAVTGLTKDEQKNIETGYYQGSFANATKINQVKVFFPSDEADKRTQDIAVDVQLADGTWKRVAEEHNITWEGGNEVKAFQFAEVEAKEFRVTANLSRVRDEGKSVLNFRVLEIEAHYDDTISSDDYTGTDEDSNERYNIAKLTPSAEEGSTTPAEPVKAAIDKMVATSPLEDFPVSRAFDGVTANGGADTHAITGLTDDIGYYQGSFAEATKINQIKVYFPSEEADKRTKDIAVDVKLADGTWKRVAEEHNISWEGKDEVKAFQFAEVEATEFRVTANLSRVRDEGKSLLNFRILEIEAWNDASIQAADYTGVAEADNAKYAIAAIDSEEQEEPTTPAEPVKAAIDEMVATSPLEDYPVSRAFDGVTANGGADTHAITGLTDDIGYYQGSFAEATKINQVKVFFPSEEADKRTKDIAVDVKLADGTWKRVAEEHNISWRGKDEVKTFQFEEVEATEFRVTANLSRVRDEGKSLLNFRILEIEAWNDAGIQAADYTGVAEADNAKYAIAAIDSEEQEEKEEGKKEKIKIKSMEVTDPLMGYDIERAYDGVTQNAGPSTHAITNRDNTTQLAYYEASFEGMTKISQVKIYFPKEEYDRRPQDIAVDVLLSNGSWKRVAEKHNIQYKNADEVIDFNFEVVEAKGFRVTGSFVRTRENNNNAITNFRVVEIEAYLNTFLTEADYTGVQADADSKYNIPLAAPKTGDTAQIVPFTVLCFVSLAGAAYLLVERKRKYNAKYNA